MSDLVISQVPGTNSGPAFVLTDQATGNNTQPVTLPSPYDFAVPNANASLMAELRWYLERFLQYPFPPQTNRALRASEALHDWGTKAFKALFVPHAIGWLPQHAGAVFSVTISSDDPHVLSWPWEALRDHRLGSVLAHRARIVRKLNVNLPRPAALSPDLPKDRINILLVTARPRQENDVAFRSIARPLVELIGDKQLPAQVKLLRPPTFDALRRHLRANPHTYHILHFDGHGGYGGHIGGAHEFFKGAEGKLIFEDDDGGEDPISAPALTELLQEHAVPLVVLNACQSAMVDDRADDPFASVAAALLKAGTRGVVAMAYSLYVSGAEAFLPPFYASLFEHGNLSEAVRRGRQEMLAHASRTPLNPAVKLDDWLVPVVYEQEPVDLTFATKAAMAGEQEVMALPPAVEQSDEYRFVGRDSALLKIEKALRRRPAGVLIHGLGGIGKTTLVKHVVQWLRDTGGLGKGCFWTAFNEDIRSADYVLNEMGRTLFGMEFDCARHQQQLVTTLKENRFVIVWDNFESVSGIEGTDVKPKLSAAHRNRLKDFVAELKGGQTKIVLTSRSDELWLEPTICQRLALGGLQGEEVWEYAAEVLDDLGVSVDRGDAEFGELLEWVGGHPLSLRVVLLELERKPVGELRKELEKNLAGILKGSDAAAHERLLSTLDLARGSLPEAQERYLMPLSLHEKYVDANHVEAMAKAIEGDGFSRHNLDEAFSALVPAGLLRSLGQSLYEIHPLLSSYLRGEVTAEITDEVQTCWQRAFVDLMGDLAGSFTRKQLHEQRVPFTVHGANFHRALDLAKTLEMQDDLINLAQALGAYARNSHDYAEAETHYSDLVHFYENRGEEREAAAPYHQLGIIAQLRRDREQAEEWYRKALAISEKQGNEHEAAITYHTLGTIAEERRDFEQAEAWCRKSLAISEKLGDEHGAGQTYHQLGFIAQERRDLEQAEAWYRKSLAISEKLGNEHGAAIAYHNLGRIAQERRDREQAEAWYRKSLAIFEKLGNEHEAASTYHHLGMIAHERRDYEQAEEWYRKSLAISEKLGDEHGAAMTFNRLGSTAQKRRDFEQAEAWYRKSLAILEKQGDRYRAAITYLQLGSTAQKRRDFEQAEAWCRKSLAIFEKQGDEHGAALTYHQLGIIAEERRDYEQAEARYRKSLAISEKLGNEHDAASTYHQLGIIAQERRDFEQAGQLILKALAVFDRLSDSNAASIVLASLSRILRDADGDQKVAVQQLCREALGEAMVQRLEEEPNEH